eukprot:12152-Rhodomonas_salina.1
MEESECERRADRREEGACAAVEERHSLPHPTRHTRMLAASNALHAYVCRVGCMPHPTRHTRMMHATSNAPHAYARRIQHVTRVYVCTPHPTRHTRAGRNMQKAEREEEEEEEEEEEGGGGGECLEEEPWSLGGGEAAVRPAHAQHRTHLLLASRAVVNSETHTHALIMRRRRELILCSHHARSSTV